MFYEKGVPRNFTKLIGKHPCQRLFYKKVAGFLYPLKMSCNFIKKESLAHVFFCEFYEISKNAFFTEHLLTTASEYRVLNHPSYRKKQHLGR